jgi:hypothetical protein
MNKRTKDSVIACLALAAVAISIYFSLAGRSQRVNVDTYEVLGTVTAEETAKLIGNKGQVLVMARDSGADKIPSLEAELLAFYQTLKKHAAISVITEKVTVTPMLMMSTGGGVPPDELFKALETHANVAAVVLFFGFPQLADAELETLKKYGAKTIVVSSFHPDYKRLLEQQAIHMAIVPRPDSPEPGGRAPRTLRERFDQDYAIVSAADAARAP